MDDESSPGSGGMPDRRRPLGRGSGEQSPLQGRAQFFKNWSWDLVISLNRGACERGKAQHGINRETQEAVAAKWQEKRAETLTLLEALDFLRSCHRGAPFLFFYWQDLRRCRKAALSRFSRRTTPVKTASGNFSHCSLRRRRARP